jgi:hypothetical protein
VVWKCRRVGDLKVCLWEFGSWFCEVLVSGFGVGVVAFAMDIYVLYSISCHRRGVS